MRWGEKQAPLITVSGRARAERRRRRIACARKRERGVGGAQVQAGSVEGGGGDLFKLALLQMF